MVVTLVLSVTLMAALFLLIFVAVVLVKDRRLFKTAPKDIQAAIREHEEPFRGARTIGWILILSILVDTFFTRISMPKLQYP